MQRLLDYVNNKENNVHALTVICYSRPNEVFTVYEPVQDKRFPVYSATKSILSIGVGFLEKEGRLDINKPLADYLTGEQLSLLPRSKRAAFCALPMTRFLTMSLKGYPFRPEGESGWIEQALGADVDYEQAPTFSYSNFPALLVGIAAQNAAGEPFGDYLERTFLRPLGIIKPAYKLTPEGYFYGASGMELSTRELMCIGGCVMNMSRTDGYLSKAVSRQISTDKGGYGYFWWAGDGYYYISGKWGQKCIIFPESGTVITYLSDRPQGDAELFELAVEFGKRQ